MFSARAKLVSRIPQVTKNLERRVDETVGKHTEAAASVAYQLTPVSDNNEPGHVHTRDTIHVYKNTRGNYELRAGGAMKFLEFGTMYIPAYAIMRTAAEKTRPGLIKDLRRLKVL